MTIKSADTMDALEHARAAVQLLFRQVDETPWLKDKDKQRLLRDVSSMMKQMYNIAQTLEIFEGHLTAAEEGWQW